MGPYIIRRLILAVVVIFILSVAVFMMIHLVPGDAVRAMLGQDASEDAVQALRKELWLDRPILVQYEHWFTNAIKGDFGNSYVYRLPVKELVAQRLPLTLNLSVVALILSSVVGISAGIICAVKRGSILDQTISVMANSGIAVPIFWLAILGVYLFSLILGWLPVAGYTSPLEDFGMNIRKLIMPVLCLSVTNIAIMTRQTRSTMLEVIREDYIRTARSKGLSESVIIFRHALKNAFIPIITLLGMSLPILVGGSVLIETVFNIPGMGRLLVNSVIAKDFTVVQGVVLIIAVLILLANLIVDISYGWFDPRVRYQ